jgi:hypothetical protein
MCALYFILQVEIICSLSLIQIQIALEIYKGFWKIEKLLSPLNYFGSKPYRQPNRPTLFVSLCVAQPALSLSTAQALGRPSGPRPIGPGSNPVPEIETNSGGRE